MFSPVTTRTPGMFSPKDDARLRSTASSLGFSSKSSSSSSKIPPITKVSSKAGDDLSGDWISILELVVDTESSGEVGGVGEVSVPSLV